jgi:hypothetical protein
MLSAIVLIPDNRYDETESDPTEGLIRSLGSLVTVAVAGLIGDVIIAGPSGYELGTIADNAGCRCVEAGREADWLNRALSLARGPACLVLRAGYIPGPGFMEELRIIVDRSTLEARFWRAEPEHWAARLCPGLAPIAALVAPLDRMRASVRPDFRGVTRALKGKALRTKMYRIG